MTKKSKEILSRLQGEDKMDIYHCMMTYGTGFVKALAECMMRADHIDLKKLVDTFENYFEKFLPEKWS